MQTQYLYPSGDKTTLYQISPASFYDLNDFTKSTSSSSGYFSYIDEGITTANDNDFIYISGHYQASGIENPWGRNYLNFDVDNLQLYPSSIALNVRCSYVPDIESGMINVVAYLCNSGAFYTASPLSGFNYVNGLNNKNIVASSIFTVTSGIAFSNHITNMLINQVAASSVDKYNDFSLSLGYFYTPTTPGSEGYAGNRRNGIFKISAIELIASGEYLNNKYLPLQVCGGDYLVRTDKLLIYHDYSNYGVGEGKVFQRLVPDDEVSSITYEYAHDLSNQQSPVMCLNQSTDRSNIFRDCFFDFERYSGTNQAVDFYSSKSSHKLYLNSSIAISLSGTIYRGRSYNPNGSQISTYGHQINEDSFVRFKTYMNGVASGCLPSGDFAMWIGASQLPQNPSTEVEFIRSASGDFSFGVSASNRIYADLTTSSGTSERVIGTLSNTTALGVIVNYDFNGLTLYKMLEDGSLLELDSTSSFNRISYGIPSGNLLFRLSPATFPGVDNLNLNLYEFGVVNSGLSNSDLSAVSRHRLFDSTHNNTLLSTVVSGDTHITYRSLEDRIAYSSTFFSGDFYNFGRYKVGADNYAFLIPSNYDSDMNNIAIRNKYQLPYVDITENCFLSGTHNLFFQDGTLYFSGWIDASTTNPSGFLQNNLFVRILQDKSIIQDIPDTYYTFGTPATSSTIFTRFSGVPTSDGNKDNLLVYTAVPSTPYYSTIDEQMDSANTSDYYYVSHSSNVQDVSGYIGFKFGDINITNMKSGIHVLYKAGYYSTKLGDGFSAPEIYLLNGSGAAPFTNVVASSMAAVLIGSTISNYDVELVPNPSLLNTNMNDTYLYFKFFHTNGGASPTASAVYYNLNLVASGDYTQTTSETGGGPEYYNLLTEAKGKVAAGTTTLRSGLNEYIFPLEKSLYRFDLYTNINNANQYRVVPYDKTLIEHIGWDGADVSLYFASYNDTLNSGYVDTLKFYTAAIVTESWSAPAEYASGNLNLSMSGIGFSQSGINLFVCSNFAMSGTDLYLHAGTSTSSIMPLYTIGGTVSSGIDLFLGNYQSGVTSSFNLYTFASPYPSSENIVNLYINSTTNSGLIKSLDMTIRNSGFGTTTPLYLKGFDNDENNDSITLVIWNDTTAKNYVDLFLNQNNSSINDNIRLFIRGNGLYDGAYFAQSGHTLTIGAGADPYSRPLYLTLPGPSGITYGNDLFISGGNYMTSSMDLVIGSSTGFNMDQISLYSHGF